MTLYKIKTCDLNGNTLESKLQYSNDFMQIVRKYKKLLKPGLQTYIIDWHTEKPVCRVYNNGFEMLESR